MTVTNEEQQQLKFPQPQLSAPLNDLPAIEKNASSSSSRYLAIDINPDAAPPPFAPYEAEFFENDDGDIISHDHHLNEDGEALFRFLLSQSAQRPNYVLSISGTHTEQRTRVVTRTTNGQTQTHHEHYTVTITDFSFHIDLTRYIVHGPTHVSLPDWAPGYRGLMVRQVMIPPGGGVGGGDEKGVKEGRRKATSEEVDAFKNDEYAHESAGVPIWLNLDGSPRSNPSESSMSLREWADEYAASPKKLKELVYEKRIYGWNTTSLSSSLSSLIAQTGYSGRTSISFTPTRTRIYIRPDNGLSRTLSRTLYKVLLWICLVYPFIWLFKRFSRWGGGRWEVYGGFYALKIMQPLEPGEDTTGYIVGEQARVPTLQGTRVVDIPSSDGNGTTPVKVQGYREGEWFREWEGMIKRCASMRMQRSEPFMSVEEGPAAGPDPGGVLDGYAPVYLDGQ